MATQMDTAQREIVLIEEAHIGDVLAVEEAQPRTRFMLMAGKPYGEMPIYNGPYVD